MKLIIEKNGLLRFDCQCIFLTNLKCRPSFKFLKSALAISSQIPYQSYSQPLRCTALAPLVDEDKALMILHHDVPNSLVPDFRFLELLGNALIPR